MIPTNKVDAEVLFLSLVEAYKKLEEDVKDYYASKDKIKWQKKTGSTEE